MNIGYKRSTSKTTIPTTLHRYQSNTYPSIKHPCSLVVTYLNVFTHGESRQTTLDRCAGNYHKGAPTRMGAIRVALVSR